MSGYVHVRLTIIIKLTKEPAPKPIPDTKRIGYVQGGDEVYVVFGGVREAVTSASELDVVCNYEYISHFSTCPILSTF